MRNDTIVVRYTSECDVEHVTKPITRDLALIWLKLATPTQREKLDLIDANTGRFVSWVIR